VGGRSIDLVSLPQRELPSHVSEHPRSSDNHHGGSNPDGADSEFGSLVKPMKLLDLPHRDPSYQQRSLSSVSKAIPSWPRTIWMQLL
jgi:hypothetical protein